MTPCKYLCEHAEYPRVSTQSPPCEYSEYPVHVPAVERDEAVRLGVAARAQGRIGVLRVLRVPCVSTQSTLREDSGYPCEYSQCKCK
jgi:hypothetical protein